MKMEAAALISTTTTNATVSLAHQVMTEIGIPGGSGQGGGGIPLRFTKCQYSGKKSFEALAAK